MGSPIAGRDWSTASPSTGDFPYPIHLVSNFKDCGAGDITTLKVGDLVSWSERLLAALSRVYTPYILFLQEDYWLTSPVRH